MKKEKITEEVKNRRAKKIEEILVETLKFQLTRKYPDPTTLHLLEKANIIKVE